MPEAPPVGVPGSGLAIDIPGARKTYSGSDEDILTLVAKRINVGMQMRLPYETEWIRNWKAYRAYIDEMSDPADWWRSNVFIPEMFNAVETILPRLILGMFSRPEWFGVKCPHYSTPGHPGIGCADYERMIKSLLISTINQIRRPSLFEETLLGQKYATIMGHCWFKLVWDRETMQRMMSIPTYDPMTGELRRMSSVSVPSVGYDNPRLRALSNFRVWADPTGNNEWIVEEIETTHERLLQTQQDRGIYKNLDLLYAAGGEKPRDVVNRNVPYAGGTTAQREAEITAVEGWSQATKDIGYEGTKVVLRQHWGRVPYTTADGFQWRLQEVANDFVVIRDVPAPTPDMMPPYFASRSIPIPGFVYGDSVLRYGGPLNDQLNRIENFRMDEVVLGIWQQYVANKNALTTQQAIIEPGGIIWVDTPNDVQTAFRSLQRQPVLQEAYREAAVKRDQMERVTGATAIQQGTTPVSRETAFSVSARTQLGNERFRLQVMFQNWTFKQELLSRMFALLQQNLPPDRLVRIVGSDYQVPVDISMIQDHVDIDIETDVLDIDNPAKQQAFAYLLQTTLRPDVAPYIRMQDLLRDTFETFLNRDGRKYVKSDEELALAQAQAALFQAAASTGQPSGPPSLGPGGQSQQPQPGAGGGGQAPSGGLLGAPAAPAGSPAFGR